jgi:glucose-1-phosphate adenylyltransferase
MALVLSGGGGDRLSVLTAERAVSAIPFGGKYRVIDFVLSNCCHSEIERIGVLTQHAPQSLHDHIGSGRAWDLDRRDARVLILQPYLTREHSLWYRGTADAVARNWDVVEEARVNRVLVLPGDHVYKMDYRPLFESHARHGAAVTLAVAPVPFEESRRFGMITLADGDRVTRLDEKPAVSTSHWASMGIALFDVRTLAAALARPVVDLATDVLVPLIEAGVHVQAHRFDGYWEDVGTLRSYYRASMDLLRPAPSLVLNDPAWPILTRDEERPPVRVLPGAELEESLVANGCRVAGRVRSSILFPGVVVEEGAEVVDSVLMQDAHVEAGAKVERAIVDKLARVGRGALVGGGGEGAEPTLVGKYAVTPPGARVGAGAVLGVGAGAADFHDAQVPAGERVRDRLERAATAGGS